MKRIHRGLLASVIFLVFLRVFTGCSGGGEPIVFTADIISDQLSDGDIGFLSGSYVVTQGPDTLFFGIDGVGREYRAFLDFPLDGSTGQDIVPSNAKIESAILIVRIKEMDFAWTVPTLLDLVIYDPMALKPIDYNTPPLTYSNGSYAYRAFNLFYSDVGHDVAIDVTQLMREVQERGLSDFQVRFCLDFIPNADGFVGIDDRFHVTATAPLLSVRYY